MDDLVEYALIFFGIAVLVGLAVAGWRGFVAYRALRRFQRTTEVAMLQAATLVAELEGRTERVAGRVAGIEVARARLEESLATAKVVAAGAREVWAVVAIVRALVPSK